MKVVILCGGRGTRLEKDTDWRPKPMVEIGGIPILRHIMEIYAHYGLKDFVLCLGYKGEVIKNYFLNYAAMKDDFTVNLKTGKIGSFGNANPDWNVTLVDTGQEAQTGARVKRIERFIDTDDFLLTYGDAVASIDIGRLIEFHRSHGKTATVTGVYPAYRSRFGEVAVDKSKHVTKFVEKPVNCMMLTSGGFFALKKEVFGYLSEDDDCVFEKEPLAGLVREGQLLLYEHKGFWHCMDTPRDVMFLNSVWKSGKIPWSVDGLKHGQEDWKTILDASY